MPTTAAGSPRRLRVVGKAGVGSAATSDLLVANRRSRRLLQLGERQHARSPAWHRASTKTRGPESSLGLRGNSNEVGREPARAIPGRRWDPTPPRRDTTVLWSAAAPSHWRATSASPRDCRSPRSPRAWVVRRRRSGPTSTTCRMLPKGLRILAWQEVARSGVTCATRQQEGEFFPDGPLCA
jgi:hypothetical protein